MGYHGEHYLHSKLTNYQYIVDENQADFMEKSVVAFNAVFEYVKKDQELDATRIGMMSYSLGGILTFYVANKHPDIRAIACMVPPSHRDKNDKYELYRNQDGLQNTAVLIVSAIYDEYIPYDNSVWTYEHLAMHDKQMLSFQSGHSLPSDYVLSVFEWLSEHLLTSE